jgi:hypothetical protein
LRLSTEFVSYVVISKVYDPAFQKRGQGQIREATPAVVVGTGELGKTESVEDKLPLINRVVLSLNWATFDCCVSTCFVKVEGQGNFRIGVSCILFLWMHLIILEI